MLAQALESELSLAENGVHGGSSLGRKPLKDLKRLTGQKQLGLSFWFKPYSQSTGQTHTPGSLAITRGWLKDGRMGTAATLLSTVFSTNYRIFPNNSMPLTPSILFAYIRLPVYLQLTQSCR